MFVSVSRRGEISTEGRPSPLLGGRLTLGHHHRRLPDAQVLAQPERRVQRGASPQVEHRAQLPLHGAAVQLREGTEPGRRLQQSRPLTRANQAGAEEPPPTAVRQQAQRRVPELRPGPRLQVRPAHRVPQPAGLHRRQPRLGHRVRPVGHRHAGRLRHLGGIAVEVLGRPSAAQSSLVPSPRVLNYE